jgi:hypothetical protein
MSQHLMAALGFTRRRAIISRDSFVPRLTGDPTRGEPAHDRLARGPTKGKQTNRRDNCSTHRPANTATANGPNRGLLSPLIDRGEAGREKPGDLTKGGPVWSGTRPKNPATSQKANRCVATAHTATTGRLTRGKLAQNSCKHTLQATRCTCGSAHQGLWWTLNPCSPLDRGPGLDSRGILHQALDHDPDDRALDDATHVGRIAD